MLSPDIPTIMATIQAPGTELAKQAMMKLRALNECESVEDQSILLQEICQMQMILCARIMLTESDNPATVMAELQSLFAVPENQGTLALGEN